MALSLVIRNMNSTFHIMMKVNNPEYMLGMMERNSTQELEGADILVQRKRLHQLRLRPELLKSLQEMILRIMLFGEVNIIQLVQNI